MLKRFAEWYLDLPPAGPGQGTAWSFHFFPFWPAGIPPWVLLLAVAAIVAAVFWIYRRDARSLGRRRRTLLAVLRLAEIGLVLLFLSGVMLAVERTGLPVIALLIDDSASMGLEDRPAPSSATPSTQSSLASPDETAAASRGATRLDSVKSLLTDGDARFLKRLVRDHKLRVYRFSESAVPVGAGEYFAPAGVDELIPLVRGLSADGAQTRLAPSVGKVLEDLRGTPPAALIVLSDGIATGGEAERLSAAAPALAENLVPAYVVGVGSEEPARDLELYDVLVDEVAFVGDPILFSAKLKGHGFADREVAVTLKAGGSSEVLASQTVRIAADGEPVKVELAYVPQAAGEFDYTLEATVDPAETNRENNSETRHVSVREEKIRVLLADSKPRYEYRYLKHLLEREKSIELRTVLQDADMEYSAEDETVLDHFPVKREELFEFDVIVFGDVNPGYLSSSVFEHLRDFVGEQGGGIIFAAGPQFNPLAYQETPVEVLLPIEFDSARAPETDASLTDGFRPELTLEGMKGSNIFRFGASERESLEIWRTFPELYWLFEAPQLKPGAIVFAQHPQRGKSSAKLPVIAMQRYGGGKVIFHATDELWRWRFRTGDLYYGRYWVQAIRYLSRSKLLGKDRAAELATDRLIYQRGEDVQLRVRFLDERAAPADERGVVVVVEGRSGAQEQVTLTRLPEAPAVFEGTLSRPAEGSYHAWVVSPSFGEAPPAADFRVSAPQRELQQRALDRADLTRTARLTHGRYYSLSEARRLPDDLPAGRPVPLTAQEPIPLWNRWELLVLFAAALTAEWILRKRYRLL